MFCACVCVYARVCVLCCVKGVSPEGKAAVMCPKLATDDLAQLVELNRVEDSHRSCRCVVDLDSYGCLGERRREKR